MEMIRKESNKIIVVHFGSVLLYPPTITLIRNLIDEQYEVLVISEQLDSLMDMYRGRDKITFVNVASLEGFSLLSRIKRRMRLGREYCSLLNKHYREDDLVWVSGDVTTRALGKVLNGKKYVLHIMELEQYCPLFKGARVLRFPIDQYARNAAAIVVPEENRAYIQRIWWHLEDVPYVMPNKPYSLDSGSLNEEALAVIRQMKEEKRKIIIYLGVIDEDRDFGEFAKAIGKMGEEFCLYMFGSVNSTSEQYFNSFLEQYPFVKYCGFFPPPMHLSFLKYAYIGLLPYYVNGDREYDYQINALYCAPNKIFEYAGYNIPMIGTDVLGLKEPFKKYNIGICCEEMKEDCIANAIQCIDNNYDEMSKQCQEFCHSVDLKKILLNILAKK